MRRPLPSRWALPGSTCRSWASDRVNQHHRKRTNQEAFERFWRRSPFHERPIGQISALNQATGAPPRRSMTLVDHRRDGPDPMRAARRLALRDARPRGSRPAHPRRGDRQRAIIRRHRERTCGSSAIKSDLAVLIPPIDA